MFRDAQSMSLIIPQASRGYFNIPVNSSTNCLVDYGKAIRDAVKDWERRNDEELPWAELARRVGKALKKNVDPATVTRWKSGQQEPSLDEFRALGHVLGADPRVLAFPPEMPQESPKPHLKADIHEGPHRAHKPDATRRRKSS